MRSGRTIGLSMATPTVTIPDGLARKLADLAAEYVYVENLLSDPAVVADHKRVRELSIKRTALSPVVGGYNEFVGLTREAEELRRTIAQTETQDREFAAMAKEELREVEARAAQVFEREGAAR